jgi:hypothetical protein
MSREKGICTEKWGKQEDNNVYRISLPDDLFFEGHEREK